MKIKSILIVTLFLINFLSLPTLAQEYKTAPKFVRVTTNALGYNFLARHIAQKIVKKSLNKEAKGNYTVKIDSFSGVDLKKGKFRGFEIKGENISVENEFFISELNLKSLSDFNYIKYNKKPIKFMTDLPMTYSAVITEDDLNKALKSNSFLKMLANDLPLVKINNVKAKLENEKIAFSSKVKFPLCKPVKCSISTKIKIVDGKIVFDDIDTSSLKTEMAEWVLNLMNSGNLLTKMNLYFIEDTTTELEVKNINIVDGKLVVDGNVTIKKD